MRLLTTGDRLRRVADAIEKSYKTGFPHRQDQWMYEVGECGMPQCLGGHAVTLDDRYSIRFWPTQNGKMVDWEEASRDALGLIKEPLVPSTDESELGVDVSLFNPVAKITPEELRELAGEADTGAHWAKYPTYPIAEDGDV